MNIILNLVPYPKQVEMFDGIYCRDSEVVILETLLYGEEGYCLKISEKEIRIEGSRAGIFYAGRTLEQLRIQFGNRLPCMEIVDEPRFIYRGFMLDSSRHFLPKQDVLKLIDAAAYFKLNKMHWHLVDDQGWRIQIDAYPKLTEIGSKREKPLLKNACEYKDKRAYYTKEDVREIVAYASDRMVDIIPEIEIPGHESAMIAAYPSVGCMGEKVEVQTRGGIFDNLICVGREESWNFLTAVLDEIMEMFPYQFIHIGGDEACKKKWRNCPDCQKKLKELGLKDENALQQWFVIKTKEYLKQHGKKVVVWNDSLRGDKLDPDFVVQAWMGDRALITDFAGRGGKIINSDNNCYYLDYPYFMSDAHKILYADPYPGYLDEDLYEAVLGLECPLWTERVPHIETAAYLLFPRLPAMAECAWTLGQARDNDSFYNRYDGVSEYLEKRGLQGASRDHWHIMGETAEKDKERYDCIMNESENKKAIELDNAIMEEERAIYGDEMN